MLSSIYQIKSVARGTNAEEGGYGCQFKTNHALSTSCIRDTEPWSSYMPPYLIGIAVCELDSGTSPVWVSFPAAVINTLTKGRNDLLRLFKSTVHPGEGDRAAGTWRSWSYCVLLSRSGKWLMPAPAQLLFSTNTVQDPSQGMMPPTVGVSACSMNTTKILSQRCWDSCLPGVSGVCHIDS